MRVKMPATPHFLRVLLQLFSVTFTSIEGFCLENVALGKPAFQPSTKFNGPPELAVDGNKDQAFYNGSCTYTGGANVDDLYWQVDLQAVYTIRAVTITNRADANEWRLNDFDIDVYTTDPTDPGVTSEKCLTFPGSFGPVTRTLYCDSIVYGRYVRISKNSRVSDDALTLCEVAVHAYVGGGICDPKVKTPSEFIPQTDLYMNVSDFKKFSGSLMSCMVECFWLPVCDGFNFNGTGHGVGLCELIPIAMVGEPVTMSGWTFYEAICAWRLHNFDIEVYTKNPLTDPGATLKICSSFPGAFGAVTRTLFCDGVIQGRYVRVQKKSMTYKDALTLCEVAVHPRGSCTNRQGYPAYSAPHEDAYMRTSGFKEFSGSLMSCMVECFWLPVCDVFNFNGTGHGVGLCELIPVGLGKPVETPGWTFYKAACY